MDYRRLYEYRFRHVDQSARQAVWDEVAAYLYRRMGQPTRVLDPAAGRGELVSAPALAGAERWVVDQVEYPERRLDPGVKVVVGDILEVELPSGYFDGILVSNLLEHLASQEDVHRLLVRLRRTLAPGGVVCVMGPNFRYCAGEYFDCADHTLALTHVAVAEHVYAAGFDRPEVTARFLPYSVRSRLPASGALVRRYLDSPWAWPLLGKQFLVLARHDPGSKRPMPGSSPTG
ncbi:MAG: class I SAM-dependent methyltransferase [Acidimicrobiales bacterium]